MRTAFVVSVLAGLALAAPKPQKINLDVVVGAPKVTETGPDVKATADPVDYDAAKAAAAISASMDFDFSHLSRESDNDKRGLLGERSNNAPCSVQPAGKGPKPSNDTTDAFLAFAKFANIARNAPTPDGWDLSFSNLNAAVSANSYMGFSTLDSYDVEKCASLCDAHDLCTSFNIFFERDPTLDPDVDAGCPNPASLTNIKCSLWGSEITPESAVNTGETRAQFQVVMAGSNGYTKSNPPIVPPGFNNQQDFGNFAINAPLSSTGEDTYLGVKYWPGLFDAGQCAAACTATTAYNQRHSTDGTYKACNFFNAYMLSKNNVAEGTYCSMYTQPWTQEYATNGGQYRGSDYYTVSSSFGFSLDPQDSGNMD